MSFLAQRHGVDVGDEAPEFLFTPIDGMDFLRQIFDDMANRELQPRVAGEHFDHEVGDSKL